MGKISTQSNIGTVSVKNVIVFPPVFCFEYKTPNHILQEQHINHYVKRAKGGAGLIIVEATAVAPDGALAEGGLGLWNDEQTDGFRQLKKACEQYDAKVLVQLNFAGVRSTYANAALYAPSTVSVRGKQAVVMTKEDIVRVQDAFVSAAIRAKKAGLDGIEIHGAHGYLLSYFFDPTTNTRTDCYGKTAQNRARFATEIISRIRKETGNNFIISCRMGSDIPDVDGAVEIARLIENAGADVLHISTGTGMPNNEVPDDFPCNVIVYNAVQMKKHVNIPVIAVNKILTPEQCNYLIEGNMVDFVACARAMLADEDFANAVLSGNDNYIPCSQCKKCFWFSGEPFNCPGQIKKHSISKLSQKN